MMHGVILQLISIDLLKLHRYQEDHLTIKDLQKGDYVDINPIHCHPDGNVEKFKESMKIRQVEVSYDGRR